MNTDLPLYKCHKVVRAGIIHSALMDVLTVNIPGVKAVIDITVPTGWCKKHDIQHGGYYVEYEDGYQSYSPADVFEAGYKLVQEAEQFTSAEVRSAEATSASGITADNLTAFDYVGEAKRHTLSQILIGRSFGGSTLTDIANEITKAFDALEGKPLPHASQADYAELRELNNGLQKLSEDFDGRPGLKYLDWLRETLALNKDLRDQLQKLGEDFGCPGGVKRLHWLRTQLDELAKRRADDSPDLEDADFSDALMWLKEKRRVARKGWNGKSQHVEIWTFPDSIQWGGPNEGIPMQPCFVLINTQGNAQPGWIPSTGDLMATDWYVVE